MALELLSLFLAFEIFMKCIKISFDFRVAFKGSIEVAHKDI